jgi:hypothetical protein
MLRLARRHRRDARDHRVREQREAGEDHGGEGEHRDPGEHDDPLVGPAGSDEAAHRAAREHHRPERQGERHEREEGAQGTPRRDPDDVGSSHGTLLDRPQR